MGPGFVVLYELESMFMREYGVLLNTMAVGNYAFAGVAFSTLSSVFLPATRLERTQLAETKE